MDRPVGKPLNSLLKMAVLTGVETAVRMHVRRGDDLNARDRNGMTPLMLAAARNKGGICSLLLSAGADPTLTDPGGRDALAFARAAGATRAILVLEPLAREAITEVTEGSKPAPEKETEEFPTPSDISFPRSPSEAAPKLDDEEDPFDLSGWQAEEDSPAPEDNGALSKAAEAVHEVISAHVPIDHSEDWADFDAFLPDRAVLLPKVDDEEGRMGIRRALRRGLREGSVPEREIGVLSETDGASPNASGEALLRLVLGDLGAETDERLEPEDFGDVWGEREVDEDVVSEALAFLDDIGSGRNDPMRLYMRDMRAISLLTADEEIALGREMEDGLSLTLDALATWPEGISALLSASEKVRSGEIEVESISEGRADEQIEAVPESILLQAEEQEEEEGSRVALSLAAREFLETAGAVRALASSVGHGASAEQLLRNNLAAARLSPAFLTRLVETPRKDTSNAAKRFSQAIARYARARERMTVSNLRLVISVVKRYQGLGLPLEDLVQEGNVGLMKAVDRYDWRKGFRFSTYATWWIRQQATRAIADKGSTIRTPVHVRDTMIRIAREVKELERDTSLPPSAEVLSRRLSLPAAKVSALMARMEEPTPLHEPDSSGKAPGDSLIDESVPSNPSAVAERVGLISTLERMLSELDPRQGEVIAFRFGLDGEDPRTLEETGEHYGVTRERIRQIEAAALKRLAHPVRSDVLKDFLSSDLSSYQHGAS